ncbi:MAG: tRNA (adenosine(37)-N6)-threonylcarbamoyltransferase complex ATPase subunit type 1 TsaE [Candidatus Omnitrophica bacterium]|nr:tRNA (adenosine(37)-N6)-threonylcarbamoyltransferase complex ATPase subunit type 1 TsaE [Candidatus Omnitrophota bacterium]
MKITFTTTTEQETKGVAQELSKWLFPGSIICLFGDLGSGKTTFVKGLAQGLSIAEHQVHSPTFTLMNYYEGRLPVYHFDLYRLESEKEIEAIGYEDFLYAEGVSLVEWAERFQELMPEESLHVRIHILKNQNRLLEMSAHQGRYLNVLEKLTP